MYKLKTAIGELATRAPIHSSSIAPSQLGRVRRCTITVYIQRNRRSLGSFVSFFFFFASVQARDSSDFRAIFFFFGHRRVVWKSLKGWHRAQVIFWEFWEGFSGWLMGNALFFCLLLMVWVTVGFLVLSELIYSFKLKTYLLIQFTWILGFRIKL